MYSNQRIVVDFGPQFDFTKSGTTPQSCSVGLPLTMVFVQRFLIFHLTDSLKNPEIDLCVDGLAKSTGGLSDLQSLFDLDFAANSPFHYPVKVSLVYQNLVLSREQFDLNRYFYQKQKYPTIPTLAKLTFPKKQNPALLFKLSSVSATLGSIPKSFVFNHRLQHLKKLKVNSPGVVSLLFESPTEITSSDELVLKFFDVLDNSNPVLTTSGSTIDSLLLPPSHKVAASRAPFLCIFENLSSQFDRALSAQCSFDPQARHFYITPRKDFLLQKDTRYKLTISSDHLEKSQLIFTTSRR